MRTIESVAIGTVSKVDAELGRIKVTFKWMKPEQESHWAPIASLLAGKQRGARFMPEEHDEVLVAFDRGNYEHPYIVGFLWNDVDKSPDNNEHNRLIVTPGGHELRFEDKDGDKRVVLKTKEGHRLALDEKDRSIKLTSKEGHNLRIDDAAGKVVLSDKNGSNHVTIEMAGTIKVQASSQVTVEAPNISLTEGASHPVVFGDLLLQYLNTTLLPVLQTHLHQPQFALGIFPVTPALPVPTFPPATPAINSMRVKSG